MFNLESIIETIGLIGVISIVFAESGLLIGFFLPGDSLLFTAGFLASQGFVNIWALSIGCFLAAVIGDSVGYSFGHRYGRKLFDRPDSRFFKKEYLTKAEAFYQKHGSKTIVIARFVPVVRTFAPIVAGVAKMSYGTFLTFNILGGALWALGITWLGYWLGGTVEGVDRYIIPVLILIIILSILPGILHMLRAPEHRATVFAQVKRIFGKK